MLTCKQQSDFGMRCQDDQGFLGIRSFENRESRDFKGIHYHYPDKSLVVVDHQNRPL